MTLSGSIAQVALPHKKVDLDIEKFNIKTIRITAADKKINLPSLSSIHIVDARPDTSSIGLAQNYNQKPYFINTSGYFSAEAGQFVKDYVVCDKSDSLSVVMVIKKFWICGIMDKDNSPQFNGLVHDSISQRITNLQARIEFYLKSGFDYYVLYRFDSTFTRPRWASQDAAELVAESIKASLSKLVVISPRLPGILAERRKFSWDQIEMHNKKGFDLPILKDSLLRAGVYFSFEEFKNNAPTQKEFELSNDKLTALIFIRQPDGKLTPVNNAWGYCDGKNLFIKSLSYYFRLQKRENSFYIYGSKRYAHTTVFNIPGITETISGSSRSSNVFVPGETSSESFNLKLRPFELDWDDGQLK
ncbi:MAG: hypothetical protein C5B59_19580 [Bacteroidetes bacterium]|nr:MAG: hypothetical protein C5B59_19580 [Bacteroidota bacterium]